MCSCPHPHRLLIETSLLPLPAMFLLMWPSSDAYFDGYVCSYVVGSDAHPSMRMHQWSLQGPPRQCVSALQARTSQWRTGTPAGPGAR